MRRVGDDKISPNSAMWRPPHLPTLLLVLAAGSAALAQQGNPFGAGASNDSSSYSAYRVIKLAPGLLATNPDINVKGQISFSMQANTGATAYFYNGATVQNIGTLGGSEVLAVDLNDLGQVTGSSTTRTGIERAFVWSADVGMLNIGSLPGTNQSEGAAINNRGIVTGTSNTHAFRWSVKSGVVSLGALTVGPTSVSFGIALNDAGIIIGSSQTEANDRHAFVWTRTGGLVDIDTRNSSDAVPVAIGAQGEVAGNRVSRAPSVLNRPFLWKHGTGMIDLGPGDGNEAIALAMGPDLHIVGLINLADGTQRAMSWTRAAGMRRLSTLGGPSSRALDVNGMGQVVGYAHNKAGNRRAFIWTAKKGMLDLNKYLRDASPGLVLDDAVSINDSGAIVATSNVGLVLLRPDRRRQGGRAPSEVAASADVRANSPSRTGKSSQAMSDLLLQRWLVRWQ